MEEAKPSRKMFLEIVQELQSLIRNENIRTGEKLPSERVLAERLGAGRSTVREALRSLELLGLIETRRGEGTFLSDYRQHQLVDVLAAFIMQEPKSLEDVRITMQIHERDAALRAASEPGIRALPLWDSLWAAVSSGLPVRREDIIREVLVAAGNRLSLKIWYLLNAYAKTPYAGDAGPAERPVLQDMIKAIKDGDGIRTANAYDRWAAMVSEQRGN
ncbi:FadR/GntR family transcriptional regulator [Edaphobacillus lindanitolerans]|uniref:Transcriptional regulator, GntR family n=1 Tax=Edaphobacillus lindanitolerans TaxID=550447 RepID=A0A1U7PQU2_9BACI|nr:GntR family transcriptional regulator [Edaphobacillus lindanitolerans]SIT85049.1 transcriptional regulator, GntR family [Edaphobacillus lindanitolerans]